MIRIIAVSLLFIPGILAAYGIKLMRDALFHEFNPIFFHAGIQFFIGIVLLVGGIWFIGGFLVHRDKKKNLIQKKHKRTD
ncbi:DUF2627 domain-containing protein [Virgibacillus sp. NKC19-3]|uniref:DUF2627 domain-containing protein n=1 Tax=Virgibacillus saliphilus TaxID=2831674 RepID=UPI001C9AC8A5|nr:DUF2627 domain-containing protein [Virgibacillus sp. NKC19-3]MBY7143417.1 DUF2627 domain-containing protein [Virgibacillus sp. NKC19-3]